jgi:hypothetical protein
MQYLTMSSTSHLSEPAAPPLPNGWPIRRSCGWWGNEVGSIRLPCIIGYGLLVVGYSVLEVKQNPASTIASPRISMPA